MISRKQGGQLQVLTDQQLERIHQATLRILREIGVVTNSDKILEIFSSIGAQVNGKHGRIKVSPELVEEALEKVPDKVVLHGRNREKDISLEDSRVHFGFGGTPTPYFRNLRTGRIRRSTKKDVEEATRLADALPHISFVMSIAGAYDVPSEVEYLHELDALFNNTTKPIIYVAPGAKCARKALEMADLARSESENQNDIPLVLFSESTSPLCFSEMNENIIECATAGVPVIFGAGPILGVTGPVTTVGSFTLANAETLFALVLSQAVRKNSPFIYGPHITVMDMKTSQVCYAAPESAMIRPVLAQLSKYYKLPSFAATGLGVDSKYPDAQAGVEAAIDAFICALSGVNLVQNVGTMAGGSYGSMKMAVICDEIIGIIDRIFEGVKVDEDAIAIDVLREVGPSGNFLSHEHTLEFFRNELYMPSLFDRHSYVKWEELGRKSLETRAREKTQYILAKHQVKLLPANIQQKLDKILKESEKEFQRFGRLDVSL